MQVWIRSLTQLAYRPNTIVARWRAARMRAFRELVKPPPGARIVDLGGTVQMWSLVEHDYRITLVNLPGGYGADADAAKAAGIDFVLGDACDLKATFGSQSFDVVFSNSVIEHVGGEPQAPVWNVLTDASLVRDHSDIMGEPLHAFLRQLYLNLPR